MAWTGAAQVLPLLIAQAQTPALLLSSITALGVLLTRERFPPDALGVLFEVIHERACELAWPWAIRLRVPAPARNWT